MQLYNVEYIIGGDKSLTKLKMNFKRTNSK